MPVQHVYRVHSEAQITKQSALVRKIVARSVELLNLPVRSLAARRRSLSCKRKAGTRTHNLNTHCGAPFRGVLSLKLADSYDPGVPSYGHEFV